MEEKCNFFSFLIKLNIRASILGGLLNKKDSTSRVTDKNPMSKICQFKIPQETLYFPWVFFKLHFLAMGTMKLLSEARNQFLRNFTLGNLVGLR